MLTRIAVLVSGHGSNFQALIDARRSGILVSGEIALAVSSKSGAYAIERAKQNGIPYVIAEGSDEGVLLNALEEYKIDVIVLAGYIKILSVELVSRYKDRIINIHPSLLPSFCGKGYYGLRVHEAALKRGVKVTGATVHFVNEVPDGGRILLQKAVEVKEGDTSEQLQRRVMEQAEWVLLPEATELLCRAYIEEKNYDR